MPDIPKGHKVIDTVKDNKGFYQIIQRPDGTKYSQTLKLFTEQDNDRKVRAENKSLGQLSTTNIKGNAANAMALTAVGGGAASLALHNATQGRQGKVGRKVRGAAFGSTRPQGAGLKTPAGTAGDVRGRVSTDRPPAIVRSVDSFNQRGSTMPQTGNLFDQPEPPSGGNKKASGKGLPAGRKAMPGAYRYAKKGSAKILSQNYEWLKGQADRVGRGYIEGRPSRGVPKPVQGRPSGAQIIGRRETFFGTTERAKRNRAGFDAKQAARAAGTSTPTPTQARPTPLAPSRLAGSPVRPKFRPSPLQPPMPSKILDSPTNTYTRPGYSEGYLPGGGRPPVKGPGGTEIRPGQGSIYDVRSKYDPNRLATRQGLPGRIQPQLSGAAQAAQEMASKSSASSGAKKAGTRYAPAGTAKATGKGTRGVPRPSPRSNFKPATGSKPTGGTSLTGQRTALRPTPMNPNYRPGPVGQLPNGPLNPVPGPLGRTQFSAPKPPKVGMLGKLGAMVKGSGPIMAAGHLLEDAYSGIQSAAKGDWKNAGRRANDLLGHGPTGPLGFVAGDVATVMQGKKITRGVPSSIGDRIVHGKVFPNKYYSDSAENRPAAAPKTTAPAASGGNKPAGGQKPYEPRYFPEAGGNGNAVRKPDSYLGEAFDYSLQKGTTSGSKYLEHMFRRDKVSEDDQQRLRERFNKKVVGDQTLKEYGADKGITQTLEGKKSGLGEALLGKYRDTGTYKGNTDYDVMRAAAEARMARK